MLKRILFSLGIFVVVLGGGAGVAYANNDTQDYAPCADRAIPWSEACYTITSVNDFPPPIRMDGHQQIPRIASIWVEIPANAGENLLKNASYTYHFDGEGQGTPECPNGFSETIGVLGNYGENGVPLYPSGIGISKIECN